MMSLLLALFVVLLASLGLLLAFIFRRNIHLWLGAYLRQDWRAPVPAGASSAVPAGTTRHVLFCFVDHYEPMWRKPTYEVECQRVQRWRDEYPKLCEGLYDADGRQPIHSFFYPSEEYRPEHLDKVADLCRMGLGEIDIHLHHHDDTEAGLRQNLRDFTKILVERHDALPLHPVTGQPQWGFIHGNWALDNCHPKGWGCGINNELIILREEGCYVDYTLPAAPDPCQTRTINSIYYATDDPARPKSHDTGVRVRKGGQASGDLMIIQGPLGFMWHNRKFGLIPRIENADIRTSSAPTRERVDAWIDTGIHVEGKPEWIFVKLHTHGTQERDMDTLLGPKMREAYEYLLGKYNDGVQWKTHFVSAREMYNIAKAAEADLPGEPGQYRDLVVPRPGFRAPDPSQVQAQAAAA